MSAAGDQPKQPLALLFLCVHISHNFRTKNLNLAEAKDFLALEKVLLLLSRTCTTRPISLGMLPITSCPWEQTLSISNAKMDLSRILTLVPFTQWLSTNEWPWKDASLEGSFLFLSLKKNKTKSLKWHWDVLFSYLCLNVFIGKLDLNLKMKSQQAQVCFPILTFTSAENLIICFLRSF